MLHIQIKYEQARYSYDNLSHTTSLAKKDDIALANHISDMKMPSFNLLKKGVVTNFLRSNVQRCIYFKVTL